jgi:hypothetical protein
MIPSYENDLIFLLGAGASVDAGLPTVDQLTKQLRTRLPELSDVNGIHRPEFGEVFDLIEVYDPLVRRNYERFFEWIKLLLDSQKEPFRKVIETKISATLIEAMAHLPFVVGGEISRLLYSVKSIPDYLRRLADFLPERGRLKVFSLNHDCCLEDAAQGAGINLTTGFDPATKKWNPALFRSKKKGINLYKLHGSLRWFGARDENLSTDKFQHNFVLMELKLGEKENLPLNIKVTSEPELILGPGSKIQPDDPYLTLFYKFHTSLSRAKVCIIIGYGFQDEHINSVLDKGVDKGITIIDVNPRVLNGRYLGNKYYLHLPQSAKNALINGKIKSEIEKLKL